MDYTNERLYVITSEDQYIIYGTKNDGLPEVFCYGSRDWLNQSHTTLYCINTNKQTEDLYIAYLDGSNVKV